jgi:hypothetical protein
LSSHILSANLFPKLKKADKGKQRAVEALIVIIGFNSLLFMCRVNSYNNNNNNNNNFKYHSSAGRTETNSDGEKYLAFHEISYFELNRMEYGTILRTN